jgi:hypothetical protein
MSDKQNPEDFEANRERLRTRLVDEDPLDVIVDELITLRKRIAEDIVGQMINRYEPGLSNEQLETLAWIIEYHQIAEDGGIDLAYPPPGARRSGLRSI